MDLTLSPQEEAFRDELREWLGANHPGEEPEGDEAGFEFRKAWQRKLADAGWAGLSWPEEYGGRGATLIEQAIFNEEIVRSKAPQMANVLGLVLGGFEVSKLPSSMIAGSESFVLLAIPSFIFAGTLMERCGMSYRLVDLARAMVGWMKGGLGMTTVAAEYLFSGISEAANASVSPWPADSRSPA